MCVCVESSGRAAWAIAHVNPLMRWWIPSPQGRSDEHHNATFSATAHP